jgi:hypothetical protein
MEENIKRSACEWICYHEGKMLPVGGRRKVPSDGKKFLPKGVYRDVESGG